MTSSSLWISGISLENLFVSWVFLGVLKESANVFGQNRALISLMPLVVLLIGGIVADRVETKRFLIVFTLLAACAPLVVIGALSNLSTWHITAFAVTMAIWNAFVDPSRQAVINKVSRTDIQRSIAIVFIVPSLLSMLAMYLMAPLESLGLSWVLITTSALFIASGVALIGIPTVRPVGRARLDLVSGFVAAWKIRLVREVILLNSVSALFNAGGYIVVVPLIATGTYGGHAELLSLVGIFFLFGSISSNFLLLAFMPIKRPGRLVVLLQLTRAVFLLLLLVRPPQWIFLLLVACWGLNMGVTSTLMRSTVQELAPEHQRAQILAVMLFGFMLASPISSLMLGEFVHQTSPLIGLIPGVLLSVVLFLWGYRFSEFWKYASESADQSQSWLRRLTS
ncbi:MAG: MFS transporter [Gammaproteobacteria bacterium]|nr:MFS transporter [Gammaproteobacteria bacterium]